MGEIFSDEEGSGTKGKQVASGGGMPGGSGDPNDPNGGKGGPSKGNPNPFPILPPNPGNQPLQGNLQPNTYHFDFKLKLTDILQWDGNTDDIVWWMSKVSRLANKSALISQQLGELVPQRLTGSAETWYYSLPLRYRCSIEKNWVSLRNTVGSYFMNQKWLDRMKAKASKPTTVSQDSIGRAQVSISSGKMSYSPQ